MSHRSERLLYWTPRTLAILFAFFVSMFALDVFAESRTPSETMVALGMHMIPTVILLAILYVAWRWELPGAVLFAALGLLYWSVFPHTVWVIAMPPIIIGGLFLIHWLTESHGSEIHLV